jgi:hypothetical protein
MLVLVGFALLISGCATQMGFVEAQAATPVGFWYGLWHGLIAPIAWIVSLFSSDTAIYAIYNNGGWYDFGFMWGIGTFGWGASKTS